MFPGAQMFMSHPANAAAFEEFLRRSAEQHEPRGPPPTAQSAIDALPDAVIGAGVQGCASDGNAACAECSVCQETFACGEKNVKKLPCGHLFHKDCILPWLEQHNTCPVCRFELPTAEEAPPPQPARPVAAGAERQPPTPASSHQARSHSPYQQR